MPRQSRRSAPPRHQQTRQAHTMPSRQQQQAPPPQRQQAPPPPQQQQHGLTPTQPHAPSTPAVVSQGPGLFGQMASTAAGVAVGSAVGHTLANGVSSVFGGGGRAEPAPADQQQQQQPYYQETQQQQAYQPMQQQQQQLSCEENAKAFTKCLETNNNDVSACQWYLDALKSCQQMAARY